MSKTQILITDIPSGYFKEKWPEQLERDVFDSRLPELQSHLLYYTPLAFLNRIIIILDDEASAVKVFEQVQAVVRAESRKVKLYLAESLLAKPRSKSSDDVVRSSPGRGRAEQQSQSQKDKPILSIETDPGNTGVSSASLSVGSPSLSPDRTSLESPTLLKFDSESRLHYYKEPLPRLNKRGSESAVASSFNDSTRYLFKPKTTNAGMSISTSNLPSSSGSNIGVPPSPTITLDEFHH